MNESSRSTSRFLALLLGCVLAAIPLAAQEGGEAGEKRTAVLLVETLEPQSPDALTARILTAAVGDALDAYGLAYSVREREGVPRRPELPQEQRVSLILRSVAAEDADVVIGVFYLMDERQLFVQFVLYDPIIDTVLGGVLTRSRQGLTVFQSVSSAVEDFEPVIQRYIEGGYYAEEPTGLVESILVEGATEGADIFFVERLVGRVGGGQLLVPFTQFEIGTPLQVRAAKDGYHEVEEIHPLDERQVAIRLPELERQTRFDLGLQWSWGLARGAGFAWRFHMVPDTTFVALHHYRTFQPAPESIARDVQFYDTSLSIGRYFVFSYRSPVRLHLSAGAGVIISDVDDLSGREYTDWYLLIGNPTVELNLDRFAVFLRPELKYALGLGYNVLGRVWIRTTYETGTGTFSFVPITLGVRYSW